MSYGISKAGKFHRLDQLGIGAGRIRQAHVIGTRGGGEDNNRHLFHTVVLLTTPQDLVAVHTGQIEVEENEAWTRPAACQVRPSWFRNNKAVSV